MPFVSKENNGGVPDSNINRNGRPKDPEKKKITRRSMKDKELIQLVRKLRPHVSQAIMTAVKIMGDEEASHTNQLKAAAFLFVQHANLISEAYGGEENPEEVDPDEVQPQNNTPVFSLKVVDKKE